MTVKHETKNSLEHEKKEENENVLIEKDENKEKKEDISFATIQIHNQLLLSLNKNMAQHPALYIPNISIKMLLAAWERFIILSDWIRTASDFSTAEFILLSLIFASIAHLLPKPKSNYSSEFIFPQHTSQLTNTSPLRTNYNFSSDNTLENEQIKTKRKTNKISEEIDNNNDDDDPPSFLEDYDIKQTMAQLTPIEVFYCSLVVTKMVLDIDESDYYDTTFTAIEFELLKGVIREDSKLKLISPRLQSRRFPFMKNAIFSLQLYVMDIALPLGKKTIPLPNFANCDDKIQAYMAVILQRPPIHEDFITIPIRDLTIIIPTIRKKESKALSI